MALSDHEQQLLDQLERQLRSQDPSFAQNISRPQRDSGARISPKRFVLGVIILVVGLAAVVGSIVFLPMPLAALGGVAGFAIMVFGGYCAVTRGAAVEGVRRTRPAPKKQRSSFMDRLEDRWDRRQGR